MIYSWVQRTNPPGRAPGGVGGAVSGARIFALAQASGSTIPFIQYSDDSGVSWTAATINSTSPPQNFSSYAVDAITQVGLLGDQQNDAWRSTDNGVTWNSLLPSPSNGWSSSPLAVGGFATDSVGKWVAFNANSPDVAISLNGGVTWAAHLNVAPGNHGWVGVSVAWDGTQWIGITEDNTFTNFWACTSPDGVTWASTPISGSGIAEAIAFHAGKYLIAGTDSTGVTFQIWVGTTLAAAAASTPISFSTSDLDPSANGNSIVVWDSANALWVATDGVLVATSPDGTTWTSVDPIPWPIDTSQIIPGGTGVFSFGLAEGNIAESFVSSSGVAVPSIVGLTPFAAATSLTTAGLVVGEATTAYSTTVADGLIINQNPVAGTLVPDGFAVNYTVSIGPPPVVVPSIINEPLSAAEFILSAAQLTLGTTTLSQDSSVKLGSVISQAPAAGDEVPPGSAVNITLSVSELPFNARQTVISQYANSPTLLQLIDNMEEYIDPRVNLQNFYFYVWNVDTAQGFGLDIWGRIVGVSRVIPIPGTSGTFGFANDDSPPDWENFADVNNPGGGGPFFAGENSTGSFTLSDSSFRTLILTKALANICATTAPALNQLIRNLFPGRGKCYTLDLGGMRMRYVFEFSLTTVEYAILAYSGVLPHPAGVEVSILVVPSGALGTFGFQEAGPSSSPFNYGVFHNPP